MNYIFFKSLKVTIKNNIHSTRYRIIEHRTEQNAFNKYYVHVECGLDEIHNAITAARAVVSLH